MTSLFCNTHPPHWRFFHRSALNRKKRIAKKRTHTQYSPKLLWKKPPHPQTLLTIIKIRRYVSYVTCAPSRAGWKGQKRNRRDKWNISNGFWLIFRAEFIYHSATDRQKWQILAAHTDRQMIRYFHLVKKFLNKGSNTGYILQFTALICSRRWCRALNIFNCETYTLFFLSV